MEPKRRQLCFVCPQYWSPGKTGPSCYSCPAGSTFEASNPYGCKCNDAASRWISNSATTGEGYCSTPCAANGRLNSSGTNCVACPADSTGPNPSDRYSCSCTAPSSWDGSTGTCKKVCTDTQYYDYITGVCKPCPAGTNSDQYRYQCLCPSGLLWVPDNPTCVDGCSGEAYYDPGTLTCRKCPTGSTGDHPVKWYSYYCTCGSAPFNPTTGQCMPACTGNLFVFRRAYCAACPTGSVPTSPISDKCSCTDPLKSWGMDAYNHYACEK